MPDTDLQGKWDARYRAADSRAAAALEVLVENAHLMPRTGRALDLACGFGGSALWLARRGLQTTAWDLSPVAIADLQSRSAGLPVTAEVRDVVAEPPREQRYDIICVGHFLERALCPAIAAALKPGGLLCYQTYARESVDDSGPGNPLYRLAPNELLGLFADLTVRFYRDEGRVGDVTMGFRNRVQLVAQRAPRD